MVVVVQGQQPWVAVGSLCMVVGNSMVGWSTGALGVALPCMVVGNSMVDWSIGAWGVGWPCSQGGSSMVVGWAFCMVVGSSMVVGWSLEAWGVVGICRVEEGLEVVGGICRGEEGLGEEEGQLHQRWVVVVGTHLYQHWEEVGVGPCIPSRPGHGHVHQRQRPSGSGWQLSGGP